MVERAVSPKTTNHTNPSSSIAMGGCADEGNVGRVAASMIVVMEEVVGWWQQNHHSAEVVWGDLVFASYRNWYIFVCDAMLHDSTTERT